MIPAIIRVFGKINTSKLNKTLKYMDFGFVNIGSLNMSSVSALLINHHLTLLPIPIFLPVN